MQAAVEIIDLEAVAALHNLDAVALAIFADHEGYDDPDEAADAFQDAYGGTFADLETWAESFIEDTGMLDGAPEVLRRYFDFAAWSRDAELNGDIWTADVPGGDIAVFWNR